MLLPSYFTDNADCIAEYWSLVDVHVLDMLEYMCSLFKYIYRLRKKIQSSHQCSAFTYDINFLVLDETSEENERSITTTMTTTT